MKAIIKNKSRAEAAEARVKELENAEAGARLEWGMWEGRAIQYKARAEKAERELAYCGDDTFHDKYLRKLRRERNDVIVLVAIWLSAFVFGFVLGFVLGGIR